MQDRIPDYISALCLEIQQVGAGIPEGTRVHSIFFGGGTPSLLTVTGFDRIMAEIKGEFQVIPGSEITLEANPGTVTQEYLAGLISVGFNRISFGMQTADPRLLRILERQHDTYDVFNAVKWARQAGFTNINLDLIYGLPDQTLEQWKDSLEIALGMAPEHLSLYALTVEEGTPLYRWVGRGLLPYPDADLAADMYEWAQDRLEEAGYSHYEISNWSRKKEDGTDLACRHNLQYWRNWPYLGFGAGAHGYCGGMRIANAPGIQDYISHIQVGNNLSFPQSSAATVATPIDRFTEMQETMMVGLRLTIEGVRSDGFFDRFGVALENVFGKEINDLIAQGLLEWSGSDQKTLRLTLRGHLLGNRVFMQFVGGRR
jgi:oxygen-independent coproporphyrinogen III oxidase